MPLTNCKYCNQEFYVPASRATLGRGIYCSRQCLSNDKKTKKQKKCAYCAQPIQNCRTSSLYCSRKCSARAMYGTTNTKRKCSYCDIEFYASSIKDKYCSRLCEAKNLHGCGKLFIITDPWGIGSIDLDCYDKDYKRMPDNTLGF